MILGGTSHRLDREHNDRAWLAWHIVALGMQKKMPKLETLLRQPAKRRQTPEEIEAIARSWLKNRRSR